MTGSPSQVSFNFNPPREDLQNGLITHYRISCVDRNRTRAAVSETILSSAPRPYTFSDLVPATLYDCSLSARTSVGFGVEATVEVLTSKGLMIMTLLVTQHLHLSLSLSLSLSLEQCQISSQ